MSCSTYQTAALKQVQFKGQLNELLVLSHILLVTRFAIWCPAHNSISPIIIVVMQTTLQLLFTHKANASQTWGYMRTRNVSFKTSTMTNSARGWVIIMTQTMHCVKHDPTDKKTDIILLSPCRSRILRHNPFKRYWSNYENKNKSTSIFYM